MGIAIRVKGANFTNFIDREMPHIEKTVGFYLFGWSGAQSAKNLSPNSSIDATIVGAPSYGAGYVDLSETAYINTGLNLDTINGEFTMIAVAQSGSSADTFCGTWHSGVIDSMIYNAGDINTLRFSVRGSGSSIGPVTATGGLPRFMAGVKSGERTGTIYAHDGNTIQSASGLGGVGTDTAEYRIGPNGGNQTLVGTQRHFANAIFNQALTSQEITDIYNYFSFLGVNRGFVI